MIRSKPVLFIIDSMLGCLFFSAQAGAGAWGGIYMNL